ncbi:MCF.2 cell line derived transforming sequence [Rattus norvegicus]|uniref:MCF.2 cell line derived transforming sequence n=1 Tax=Rattus norvegicus TaxID=10116 RepID=A0A8I6A9Q4_RAT|nr:MCF.2 cell line derived transforming sequence [Rattus norvegicus]|eukprot:XP_008771798.1 PREDICTED: proto-oncogene DBL isoform X1 [Rattus norvegicus]
MAEARSPPTGPSPAGPPPAGSPPAPALASPWLAFRNLPKAASRAPRTRKRQLNPDNGTFVPFTQTIPVQVDMAMALHRVRIAEKYGKNYLCLLQAVFLAETGLLLQLKDINHFLMQDIAFLSGGRGRDNAWIITFPENCNFRCIPEEVIAKVLNYLTSIARQSGSDSRFTIILDRRMDTWSSLKISLQKISASFPGNLHLVLVLRPTSFLQRTFTDIGFRFSQEDFMLKLPVVMLSSVSDLLTYIDDKQLTPELGGTLQYCHSEWIIFRNAIEKFAVTVKEMAQMLQSFGTELAETELPDDIPSIEEILAGRAERYHLLKNDLTTVTKEGKVLLMNLQVPDTEENLSSSHECPQHINGDWQTIKKLLAQVHDMETAFDGFWEKHQLKMEQYLQLWKFEQEFQEVVTQVEFLLSQQRELGDVTGNLAQVKQRLKKIEILDDKSQELLAKGRIVILHGHKLASNHHYALDLICQRCNELRYLSDILVNEIRSKRIQLSRTFKMHRLLQQARQCCDQGECLLANRGMDKFQTKEDAQKALQDVDNFLQMAMPFINYDIENLQFEFDVLLSPELKAQMKNIQRKLENIRSVFENQQNAYKISKDRPEGAVQRMIPAPESVMRARTIFFSPKHVGIGYSFFQACKIFSKVKKSWRQIQAQSNVKVQATQDSQEKNFDQPPKLDSSLDILKNHVLNELIQTERAYVRELFTVLLGYRSEMDNPQMFDLMPPLLRNKKDVLFGNMAEIYEFHNNIFMSRLEDCSDAPERVGPCFLERKEDFQMYAKYCQNKPRSELIWRKYSECAFFQECQRKLKHRLGLDSYLLKPVQRITKYQLLLKELLKYSKEGEGTTKLKEALDSMLELLKSVNDSMHQTAINGYVGNMNDLGKMILQGAFSVWVGHRKGATKMKDFARFKPMQRHLFLYEKAVMFCKRRFESGEGADRYPSYSFKHCLKMEEAGITEHVKGDNRKFEIWYGEKEEIYIVQAPNIDVKMLWLKEIRNILLKQQELLTAKTQQDQLSDQDQLPPQQQNAEKQEETLLNAVEAGAEVEQASAMMEVREAALLVQAEANCTTWNGMLPCTEGTAATAEHPCNSLSPNSDNGEDRSQMRSMSEVQF